jgi:predicted NBD/HSP70 family sugar kinase
MAKEGYKANPHSLIFNGHDPEAITVENIFSASNRGDKLAQDIIDDAAKWFSLGLTNLVLTYDPDIIILQGIFVKAGDFFIQRLCERINSVSLVHIEKNVCITYSNFGTRAGVIGASAYVVSEYFR